MNNWFTVNVKYTKQLENGAFKRMSEPYILSAMTFTDAEARIYEELGSIIRGEFVVDKIARTNFNDIFHYEDSDLWFKCKISVDDQDPDDGKKRKIKWEFLVAAHSVKEATDRLNQSLSDLTVDYLIKSVVESPIVDIFPYDPEAGYEKRKSMLKSWGFIEQKYDGVISWEDETGRKISDEEVRELPDDDFTQKIISPPSEDVMDFEE